MAFQPYLFFGGNCREAFTRYQEIFGGELHLVTAADMPAEAQMPGAPADSIMHAALMGENGMLMGSDDPTSQQFGPVQGMQVTFSACDAGEVERVFEALAEGGEVRMAAGPTSWSPMFGMLVDRFGTPWMVSAEGEAPPAG